MEIIELKNESEFNEALATNKLVVVDFYSTECPPCEKLAPIFDRKATEFPDIKFFRMYRQGNRELAQKYGVSGSPSLIFFNNKTQLAERLTGEINETDFEKILLGLAPKTNKKYNKSADIFDLLIIGTGPAGLTAAVYGARYKLKQILVGELTGGLMTSSHKICNYPSEIDISGMDLTKKMWDHVEYLGVPHKYAGVAEIRKQAGKYKITLTSDEIIYARTILLSSGTKHRHLGLENEEKLTGRGISYCATCDAAF